MSDTHFLKETFSEVYKNNLWQSEESISGPGSNLNHPTIKHLSDTILYTLKNLKKDKIIIADIPCGDCNFIFHILDRIINETSIKSITYYGFDIVDELIEKNKTKIIRNEVNINFEILDIVNNTLSSNENYDIILCKELFIHLSLKDTEKLIMNINEANFKYCIMGVNFDIVENKDILYSCPGECREVSLKLPPFNCNNYIYQNMGYLLYDTIIN